MFVFFLVPFTELFRHTTYLYVQQHNYDTKHSDIFTSNYVNICKYNQEINAEL
jgi:hypothetical protein